MDVKQLLESCVSHDNGLREMGGDAGLYTAMYFASQLYSLAQSIESLHENTDHLIQEAGMLWDAVVTALPPCSHCDSQRQDPACACCAASSPQWSHQLPHPRPACASTVPNSSRHPSPSTTAHIVTRTLVLTALACWEIHQHLQGADSGLDVSTPRSSAHAHFRTQHQGDHSQGVHTSPPPHACADSWALFARTLGSGRGMALMCALQSGCMRALGKVDAPAVGFSAALDLSHTADLVHPLELGVRLQHMAHNVALEVWQSEGCAHGVVPPGQRARVAGWLTQLSSHWVLTLVSMQAFTAGTVMAQWPATARDPLLLPYLSDVTLCQHAGRLLRMLRVWWRVSAAAAHQASAPTRSDTVTAAVVCALCYALPVVTGGSAWEQVGLMSQWVPEFIGLGGRGYPMPSLPAALRHQAAGRPKRGGGAAHVQCSVLALDFLVEILCSGPYSAAQECADAGFESACGAGSMSKTLLPILRYLPDAMDKLDVEGLKLTNAQGITHLPAAAALVIAQVVYTARLPQNEATTKAFCRSLFPNAPSALTTVCAAVSRWLEPAVCAVLRANSFHSGRSGEGKVVDPPSGPPRIRLTAAEPEGADRDEGLGLANAAAVSVAAHLLSTASLPHTLTWLSRAAGFTGSGDSVSPFDQCSLHPEELSGLVSHLGLSMLAVQLAWHTACSGGVTSALDRGLHPSLVYLLDLAVGLKRSDSGPAHNSAPQVTAHIISDTPSPTSAASFLLSRHNTAEPSPESALPVSGNVVGAHHVPTPACPWDDAPPCVSATSSPPAASPTADAISALACVGQAAEGAEVVGASTGDAGGTCDTAAPEGKGTSGAVTKLPLGSSTAVPSAADAAKAAAASALAAATCAPITLCPSTRARTPDCILLPLRPPSDSHKRDADDTHGRGSSQQQDQLLASRPSSMSSACAAEAAAIGADAQAAAAAAAAAMSFGGPPRGASKACTSTVSCPVSREGSRRATASDGLPAGSGGSFTGPTTSSSSFSKPHSTHQLHAATARNRRQDPAHSSRNAHVVTGAGGRQGRGDVGGGAQVALHPTMPTPHTAPGPKSAGVRWAQEQHPGAHQTNTLRPAASAPQWSNLTIPHQAVQAAARMHSPAMHTAQPPPTATHPSASSANLTSLQLMQLSKLVEMQHQTHQQAPLGTNVLPSALGLNYPTSHYQPQLPPWQQQYMLHSGFGGVYPLQHEQPVANLADDLQLLLHLQSAGVDLSASDGRFS